jgi:transcriptional regulator GlxA family with amidase domain
MIHHIAIDGVMEGALGLGLDVIDTAQRLHRAGRAPARISERTLRQRVVSMTGESVDSVQHRKIAVDGILNLRSIQPGDVLVVPGIFATKDSSIARLLSREDVRRLVSLLPKALAKGAWITASCSASFLVAASGILNGQSATTTWWLAPSFAHRFPDVTLSADRMVVDCGRVVTAGSAFAHADLMLHLVSRIASPTLASLTAKYLVLDSRASHSRYMAIAHFRSSDPLHEKIEKYVLANLGRQITLTELARTTAMSPRTLTRKLAASLAMSPMSFVHQLRINSALHLLETTALSVEEVATRVGYSDSAAFRRIFRRLIGTSPREVRKAASVKSGRRTLRRRRRSVGV